MRLRRAVLEGVEDKVFEELLVADAYFDGLAGRAVLAVPVLHLRLKGSVKFKSQLPKEIEL